MKQGRLDSEQQINLLWGNMLSSAEKTGSAFWLLTNTWDNIKHMDNRATGFKDDYDVLTRCDALLDVYRWQIACLKAMRDQVDVGDDITLARMDKHAEGMGVHLDRLMHMYNTGA